MDQTNPVIPAAQPLNPDVPPASHADGAIQPTLATPAPTPPAIAASSLEQLVATQVDSSELTGDLKCLAGAIYFEARNESLEGQLAVGRVIVARTHSRRFPASYCGVVYQPAQFSFIHRAAMPNVDAQSHLWHRAVALAKIADAGSWQSPAEGALFFHAARVTASWRMKRVTQIDHHVFYR
jgi:spore germination cell wall hydrolase CwlJ-like protein